MFTFRIYYMIFLKCNFPYKLLLILKYLLLWDDSTPNEMLLIPYFAYFNFWVVLKNIYILIFFFYFIYF